MSVINKSLREYLKLLIDSYRYARSLQSDNIGIGPLNINNHNLFNCFLTVECPSDTNYTVPVVCLKQLVTLGYTGNFVFAMSKTRSETVEHKCVSSFFRYIIQYRNHYGSGIIRHKFFNGEVYHTYGNIIMDEDYNIILLPCVNIIKSNARTTIKKAVFIVSPEVFNNPSKIIYKFMVKSFIPYMSNMESVHMRGNPLTIQRLIPVEIEIADTHKFISKPKKPTENLEEEGNTVLRNLIDSLIRNL